MFDYRRIYERFGYRRYKMSKFEEYDLYAENKDFLLSKNIITFTDLRGRLMALKPDVTLSIVKSTRGAGMHKVYYKESVYRPDDNGEDYREITQIGLECIGPVGLYEEAEVIMLACRSLAGISADSLLDISDMRCVMSLLSGTELPGETRAALLTCIRSRDADGIRGVCSRSGVDTDTADRLCAVTELYGRPDEVLPALCDICGADETDELRRICEMLDIWGVADIVRLDPSCVGDMAYYDGMIMNGYVRGVSKCVLSGGRYDRLPAKFGLKSGAIGFAVYTDLIDELGEKTEKLDADTVIVAPDGCSPASIARAAGEASVSGSVLVTHDPKATFTCAKKIVLSGEAKSDA